MNALLHLKPSLTTAVLVGFVVIAFGKSLPSNRDLFDMNYSSAGGRPGLLIAGANGIGLSSVDGRAFSPTPVIIQTNERSWCRAVGIVVRITHTGRLWTSGDGTKWTARDTGVPFSLHDVAFGNNRFVAVGNEGAILTSDDGLIWTLGNAPTDERLRGIVYANGMFVVVGYAGTILTSRDGVHWTRRRSGTKARLQDVTFGVGLFVAVGWHGTILTSRDASRWHPSSSATTNHLYRVSTADDGILEDGLRGYPSSGHRSAVGPASPP